MFGAMLGGGEIALILSVLLIPIVLLAFVFWIWMLVDAATNNGIGSGEKVAWILIIFFTHFLGAAIYFFVSRPKRKAAGV